MIELCQNWTFKSRRNTYAMLRPRRNILKMRKLHLRQIFKNPYLVSCRHQLATFLHFDDGILILVTFWRWWFAGAISGYPSPTNLISDFGVRKQDLGKVVGIFSSIAVVELFSFWDKWLICLQWWRNILYTVFTTPFTLEHLFATFSMVLQH